MRHVEASCLLIEPQQQKNSPRAASGGARHPRKQHQVLGLDSSRPVPESRAATKSRSDH